MFVNRSDIHRSSSQISHRADEVFLVRHGIERTHSQKMGFQRVVTCRPQFDQMSGVPIPTGDKKKDKEHWGGYRRPGDVHHYSCHTCACVFVFIAILAATIAILIVGLTRGRPWALINSRDATGNFCGIDNTQLKQYIHQFENSGFILRNYTDFPYLFHTYRANIDKGLDKIEICVRECPGVAIGDYAEAIQDECPSTKRICPPYLTPEQEAVERKKGGACVCPYPTMNIMNRCVPTVEDAVAQSIQGNVTALVNAVKGVIFSIPGFGQSVMACVEYWDAILGFSVGALVVAFIWLLLLRCMSCCIVYFVVILVPILIAVIGFFSFQYGEGVFPITNENGHKIIAYVLWAIAGVLLLIIIFLWGKLSSAVQVIKISARALGGNMTTLMTPIISLITALLFWAVIVVSSVYNYTGSNFKIIDKDGSKYMLMVLESETQYLLIYNLIFAIYISVHVYFANYFAQSSAIVDWYFADKDSVCCCNCRCLYGFWLAWTKALGMITVSALIMTPLYLFILIMEYIDRKTKDQTIGVLWRCIIKCMKCCLWCFEKIMKYLNKVLLTISQIYNTGWCRSAGLTMTVMMKDMIMVLLMNSISTFILFLSKILCSGLTTAFFVLYLKFGVKNASPWWLAAIIVFVLSYLVSSFLINMFDGIIDTVFVCYQADNDLTNSGAIRPLYISGDMDNLVQDFKQANAKTRKVEAASDSGEPVRKRKHRRRSSKDEPTP